MTRTKVILICSLCFFWTSASLMGQACKRRGANAGSPAERPPATPPLPNVQQQEDASKWFGGEPEEQKAWESFIAEGQYRIAGKGDFDFPPGADSEDVRREAQLPLMGGELSAWNLQLFAAIVVDKSRTGPERFSMIIFSGPFSGRFSGRKKQGAGYTRHWLFEHSDLSRTVLRWWSGGLAVAKYDRDGSETGCYVNWYPDRKEFRCERHYRPPKGA